MNRERLTLAWQTPRHFSPVSAWVEHIPFALALVDLLRPNTVVELGTHMGDSYCAFCQAIDTLGLTHTRATAIDTWRGDDQAGHYGAEVLNNLRAYHDPLYGRFSRLLQATFDEAAGQFAPGSIDLLHIDGLHNYEAVRHDVETWLPKMSPRGVLLLHDTQVKQDAFGVWKVWEELARRHPAFEFLHGYGLGVLAVGGQPAPGVSEFLAWTRADAPAVHQVFAGLGDWIQLAREGRAVAARQPDLVALDDWCARVQTRRKTLLSTLAGLTPAPPGLTLEAETQLAATLDTHAPAWRDRTISAVIPTRNGGRLLGRVLQGLREQECDRALEIVVVDSGSTDDTLRLARDAGARVIQIPPGQFNHGLTRNLGLERSLGGLVMLLTQDAVPADRQVVQNLARAFEDPLVAGAFARQAPRPEHAALVARRVGASHAGQSRGHVSHITDRAAYERLGPAERIAFCTFDDVCSMVRRAVWRTLPFARTDFAEDLEWARRALEAGWKIVYEPAACVVHSHQRGIGYEYDRHFAHAAAMYRLFGWREITGRRQLARLLAATILDDAKYVVKNQPGMARKLAQLAAAPFHAPARVLGTYRGARHEQRRATTQVGA